MMGSSPVLLLRLRSGWGWGAALLLLATSAAAPAAAAACLDRGRGCRGTGVAGASSHMSCGLLATTDGGVTRSHTRFRAMPRSCSALISLARATGMLLMRACDVYHMGKGNRLQPQGVCKRLLLTARVRCRGRAWSS